MQDQNRFEDERREAALALRKEKEECKSRAAAIFVVSEFLLCFTAEQTKNKLATQLAQKTQQNEALKTQLYGTEDARRGTGSRQPARRCDPLSTHRGRTANQQLQRKLSHTNGFGHEAGRKGVIRC